nr:translation initiation factor IF-3 [Hippea sp. KM1]
MNENIKADKVRLITETGEQVGIVPLSEALRRAENAGLDLVVVSPNSDPIVCRIMDYGKYNYEKQKKQQKSKKAQKTIKVKELKLRPRIAENDYQTKLKMARSFLEDKNKVKFNIFLRGREIDKKELVEELIERLKIDLEGYGSLEGKPDYQGRRVSVSFVPNK